MKKTFAIALTVFLSLSLGGNAFAQQRGDFAERMKQENEKIIKLLDLNKDQQKKFNKINEDYNKKMEDLRGEMRSGDRGSMRDKMTKMREERDKAYKELFTKDQMKKYEKYLEERQKNRPQRGEGRRGGGIGRN